MSVSTFDMRRFNDTLAKFIEVTKKDAVKVINTKAYFVARRALWGTKKADRKVIERQLGKFVKVRELNPASNRMHAVRKTSLTASKKGAPLAALIINKRIGQGKSPWGGDSYNGPWKGLYGEQMRKAIDRMLARRFSSIAFLKSGWLPAIQGLEPFAESKPRGAPMDRMAKQIGGPKGSFIAATAGKFFARIENSAQSRTDTQDALNTIARKALNEALQAEKDFMESHKKMQAACDEANKHL